MINGVRTNITLTGSLQRVVTPSTVLGVTATTLVENGVTIITGDVFSPIVTFEASPDNTSDCFLACTTLTGAAPTAPITDLNCLFHFVAGQSFTLQVDENNARLGQQFSLGQFYLYGTTGDHVIVSTQEPRR